MKDFAGFPSRSRSTPLPNLFFSGLLPQMDSLAELKAVLHIFWAIYQKQGYPRYVTWMELLADSTLRQSLEGVGGEPSVKEKLQKALEQAERRGTILSLTREREGVKHQLYFINDEASRQAMDRIERGELALGDIAPKDQPEAGVGERRDIYTLYEQNIGILTPMIAEELKEAEATYPAPWIEDAFREAIDLNKRNWRYISRILESWAAEGKDDGKPGRDYKKAADQYAKSIRGRYRGLGRD
ncbi:MAG: DnaD domain-containing protein [Dehalococcoidia bacterium]